MFLLPTTTRPFLTARLSTMASQIAQNLQSTYKLNSGQEIPALGYGVYMMYVCQTSPQQYLLTS